MKTLLFLALLISTGAASFASTLRDEALSAYLIGTWIDDDDDADSTAEQTFFADGTYQGKVMVKVKNEKGEVIELHLALSGRWKVDGDVCIQTTEWMDPQVEKVPRTGRYRVSEPTHQKHLSIDIENGEVYPVRRKSG